MCAQVYLDDENKSRVVQLILTKRTEAAFELNDYNKWKEKQDFNDILKLINDSIS